MINLLAASMPQIIDAVAIVFVLIFLIGGYVKGFTKLFLSVFGTILSLLLAVLLCSTVTGVLESKFDAVTKMSEALKGFLTSIFGDSVMNTTLSEVTADKVAELGLGDWLAELVISFAQDKSIPTDTTLSQIIGPTFGYYAVMIIVVIALFIIFKILFFFVGALVNKMHSIKLVALLDKGLGLLLGAIQGIISLELIILALSVIPIAAVQDIYAAISSTFFANLVHKINLYGVVMDAVSSADIIGFVKSMIKIN